MCTWVHTIYLFRVLLFFLGYYLKASLVSLKNIAHVYKHILIYFLMREAKEKANVEFELQSHFSYMCINVKIKQRNKFDAHVCRGLH